jgi:acyl-CoA synthetase (AMP-forming)/AMP-acid ligase II
MQADDRRATPRVQGRDMLQRNWIDETMRRSERAPERRVYTFLVDGEREEKTFSNSEIDQAARVIASRLQDAGARPGDRALLIYAPGPEYILALYGCFYAGVIATPAYPPDPSRLSRSLPRLATIGRDADATIALTSSDLFELAPMLFEHAPELARLRWITTDHRDDSAVTSWSPPTVRSDDIAVLQYTSGSTGLPKGVMLSHANLFDNIERLTEGFEGSSESVQVMWVPPYHDLGLIGCILGLMYIQGHAVIMSPLHFLQRPARWLEAIDRYRGTISGGPNFAYDLCVRKTTPEQRAALDLSSWRAAALTAEPVRATTMIAFEEAFRASGFRWRHFYPCYGMAETTLLATGGRLAQAPVVRDFDAEALQRGAALQAEDGRAARTLVGCGRPFRNDRLVVVDPDTFTRCEPGRVGEIWFSGACVARGYWGDGERNHQSFGCRVAGEEGLFFRTGDLGFVDQGELFIVGRLKDMIIVRGRNHHPHDIELAAERSHPDLRPGCGAAFGIDVDGEEQVVVVYESRKSSVESAAAVVEAMKEAVLLDLDVSIRDVVLVAPGELPKTSSGKIQRSEARRAYLAGEFHELRDKDS